MVAALPAGAGAAKVHVRGSLAADGLAQTSGSGSPRPLVLSRDGRYGPGDIVLGASVRRVRGGFRGWLAVPESPLRGRLRLLGCTTTKRARRSSNLS